MYLPLLKNGDFWCYIKRIVGDTIPRGKSKSSNLDSKPIYMLVATNHIFESL